MHNSFRIDCRILPNAGLSSAIWVGNIERDTAFAPGLITSTLAVSLRFTG